MEQNVCKDKKFLFNNMNVFFDEILFDICFDEFAVLKCHIS